MKALTRWRATADYRVRWRLEFKLEDWWVGVFWRFYEEAAGQRKVAEMWICFLPCLPLHFEVDVTGDERGANHGTT